MAQVVTVKKAIRFVETLLGPVMHAKRARAIGFAVYGAMRASRLGSTEMGRALAAYRGTSPKHGIKQIDRLIGNEKFDVETFFGAFVKWVVGSREKIDVSLDWTEYASDGHSRIAINIVTRHGRATPLVWDCVEFSSLKDRRNEYEDELLYLLSRVLPKGVRVVVLADRGFGDVKLYEYLEEDVRMDYVIRFRGCITVEDKDGNAQRASQLVPANGQILKLEDAKVTCQRRRVHNVVIVKKKAMKDAWHLATSLQLPKTRIVELYGRRFTCEENFRDEKDDRFGLGFKETRVSTCARRSRYLAINALATVLLTALGAASEAIGYDRHLKSNTTTRRLHSLFRQGRECLRGVMKRYAKHLRQLLWALLASHRKLADARGIL